MTLSQVVSRSLRLISSVFFCCRNAFLWSVVWGYTAQKMKISIKDFVSKYDQICRKLRIWSHLLNRFLMKKLIVCAVLSFFFLLLFTTSIIGTWSEISVLVIAVLKPPSRIVFIEMWSVAVADPCSLMFCLLFQRKELLCLPNLHLDLDVV